MSSLLGDRWTVVLTPVCVLVVPGPEASVGMTNTYDASAQLPPQNVAAAGSAVVSWERSVSVGVYGGAANTMDIGAAKFSQTSLSERFSSGGLLAGRTIDVFVGALRSGALSRRDVPIKVVVRNGARSRTNARSARAWNRARTDLL